MTKFYTSSRFWALVILACVGYITDMNYIRPEIAEMFYVILGGHVGLRTLDRFSETIGKNPE